MGAILLVTYACQRHCGGLLPQIIGILAIGSLFMSGVFNYIVVEVSQIVHKGLGIGASPGNSVTDG